MPMSLLFQFHLKFGLPIAIELDLRMHMHMHLFEFEFKVNENMHIMHYDIEAKHKKNCIYVERERQVEGILSNNEGS